MINLEDCKSVNSDLFHKKYKYVFDIETHDRVFYLVASSSVEMTEWVDTLCNVCGFTLRSELSELILVVEGIYILWTLIIIPDTFLGNFRSSNTADNVNFKAPESGALILLNVRTKP